MFIGTLREYIRVIFYPFMICLLLAGCHQTDKTETIRLDGTTMGTSYSVQLVKKQNDLIDDSLSGEIKDILESVDSTMSTWRSDSELSRINKNLGKQWIKVSPDLLFLLNMALSISDKTKGAFDITVDPLIELWGFSSNEPINTIPDEQSIKDRMQQVGYKNLIVDTQRGAIKKKTPVRINLSAIAKGFAVDKIAEHLDKKGYAAYLIEVGGELRFKGNKPDGTGWKIAIEMPEAGDRQPHRVIGVSNNSIATSGDYRNFYEIKGRHYSHTIDPVTGRPVTHNLASVTIIDKNTAYADALATAIMVMGFEKGYEFCELNKIPAYFIIRNDGRFISKYTNQIKKYFVEG